MKCRCCDDDLSDYESSLKSEKTGEYLDTCLVCLKEIPSVKFKGNMDLLENEDDESGLLA